MPITGWRALDGLLAARHVRFAAPHAAYPGGDPNGQTTGGGHATASYHYAGTARDYGTADCDTNHAARVLVPLAAGAGAPVVELFGPGLYYRKGAPYRPSADLAAEHQNHLHAALRPGVTLDQLLALGEPAMPAPAPLTRCPNAVAATPAPSGGAWVVGADGGVWAFDGAPFLGGLGGVRLAAPIVAIVPHAGPAAGYWLVGADGGIFAYGSAPALVPYSGLAAEYHAGTRAVADAAPDGPAGLVLLSDDGHTYRFP